MTRAFTLIEVMIAVAILGIFVALAMVVPMTPMLESEDVVIRERARQWLEYEADCVAFGRAPEPATVARLQALVPRGAIDKARGDGGTSRLTVRYRASSGRDAAVALDILEGAR